MAVFKKFQGKRINAKDKNWSKGRWYVWKRVNGRIIHRSLPDAQTKEQAETAERKLIEALFNSRYGIRQEIPFAEYADGEYTRHVERNNVNQKAKLYYIKLLKQRFKGRLLSEITPQDCRDAQWFLKRKMANSSVNRVMSTLSRMFTLACENDLLDRNPMQFVKQLKEPKARSVLLTEEQKESLWKELEKDSLLFRLVVLAVNLPLRRGQLLAITPDAVDLENGLLLSIASKGRDARVIPLNSTAVHTLRMMKEDGQLPFPLKDFRKRWLPALYRAGINKKDENGKPAPRGENFTFHDLRKEFASQLIRKNVNPNVIQKLFAHSDMRITNVYMQSELDDLKAAVNMLDDIQDGGMQ